MKYFYSGASKFNAEQTDPELSLGGFISSSAIPNDLLQNIFSEATSLSIQQNKRETKLIVLQNDSTTKAATGLSLNFILDGDVNQSISEASLAHSMSKYRVAFVAPDDDNDCFEKIINSAALPFNAVFQDVVNEVSVSLPDMPKSTYLGIWITRLYDFDSGDLRSQDCDFWQSQLTNPTTEEIKDTLDLVLDFTLV